MPQQVFQQPMRSNISWLSLWSLFPRLRRCGPQVEGSGRKTAGQIGGRRAEGTIESKSFAPLQALPLCRLDVCVTSNNSMSAVVSHSVLFQIDRRCLQGRGRGKKAALLDRGHAEVKDDYILLGLPAVIPSHFSSTQRQGREWLWTPITLMSPRPAMRSS